MIARLHRRVGRLHPQIYGMSVVLRAMYDTDKEAAATCDDRMQAVRHGCEAAIHAISEDGCLTDELTTVTGTDLLWALLSVKTGNVWYVSVVGRSRHICRHSRKLLKLSCYREPEGPICLHGCNRY